MVVKAKERSRRRRSQKVEEDDEDLSKRGTKISGGEEKDLDG